MYLPKILCSSFCIHFAPTAKKYSTHREIAGEKLGKLSKKTFRRKNGTKKACSVQKRAIDDRPHNVILWTSNVIFLVKKPFTQRYHTDSFHRIAVPLPLGGRLFRDFRKHHCRRLTQHKSGGLRWAPVVIHVFSILICPQHTKQMISCTTQKTFTRRCCRNNFRPVCRCCSSPKFRQTFCFAGVSVVLPAKTRCTKRLRWRVALAQRRLAKTRGKSCRFPPTNSKT